MWLDAMQLQLKVCDVACVILMNVHSGVDSVHRLVVLILYMICGELNGVQLIL